MSSTQTEIEQDKSQGVDTRSAAIIRWGGYALGTLFVFDLLESLFPMDLLNPNWELQFLGLLIERLPVPIIATVLIFFDAASVRRPWEKRVLKVLSWALLVYGIALLLMLPLLIKDTFRIGELKRTQLRNQLERQLAEIRNLEALVEKAGPQELETLSKRLGRETTERNPDELKRLLREDASKASRTVHDQASEAEKAQQTALMKKSLKWTFQALIGATLFIFFWRATRWSRKATP